MSISNIVTHQFSRSSVDPPRGLMIFIIRLNGWAHCLAFEAPITTENTFEKNTDGPRYHMLTSMTYTRAAHWGMERQQCKISPHHLHLLFRIHLISLPIFAAVNSDVPIINLLPSVNLIRHQVFQVTRFFRGLVDGYGWSAYPGLNDGKLLRRRTRMHRH